MFSKTKYLIAFVVVVGLVVLMFKTQLSPGFDMSSLSKEHIAEHIELLTSKQFQGRLVGSSGNEEAVDYIINEFESLGVEPGNIGDSYKQKFQTIIPIIDETPVFEVYDDFGTLIRRFNMYEDYNIVTSYQGGGLNYDGEILLVGSNLLRIPKEEIKNKIVIMEAINLNPKRISYVVENGGLGIFCSADSNNKSREANYELEKDLSMEGKTGETILSGYVSREVYNFLIDVSNSQNDQVEESKYIEGRVNHIEVDITVDFPIVDTYNIIGKIEGSGKNGRILILSASIDGLGLGTNGQVFPGAIESSSGIATLMEIAKVLKKQSIDNYDTIIFAGWNGQQQQFSGSKFYLEHPIYPLEKTTLIHIDGMGMNTIEGLKVSADYINSSILRDKFFSYGANNQVQLSYGLENFSPISGFINESVPTLVLSDGNKWYHSYGDNMSQINQDSLENGAQAVLSYIEREIYKDYKIDFLSFNEKLTIMIVLLLLFINSSTRFFYNNYQNKKLVFTSIENIYYSIPLRVIRGIIKTVFPYMVILFIIVVLANISPQTNLKQINGEWVTNLSPYLLFEKSVYYLRNLLNPEVHLSYKVGNVVELIKDASGKSLKLLLASLGLSVIIGMSKGLLDGLRIKKNKISSLGTLIIFSIPDVLIVLVGLLIYVYIAVNFPMIKENLQPQQFLLPLITLMIIPSIYISRISFITTQAELDKDYIKHAKAIGMSKTRIFMTELFPAVAFTIVDTLPAIMAMLLTNMIIVEYLFNYNGISYYLLYLYNRQDTYRFVPLALTLGIIYVLFTYGISFIAKLINPLKREVKSK